MSVPLLTLHARASGDAGEARFVNDGFRLSVFLFAPIALLAKKLWGAALLWLAVVAAASGAVAAGVLTPPAALALIFVLHVVLALDAAEMERRRLARNGWPIVDVIGPLARTVSAPLPLPPATTSPRTDTRKVPPSDTDVVGLFPS